MDVPAGFVNADEPMCGIANGIAGVENSLESSSKLFSSSVMFEMVCCGSCSGKI